MPLRIVAADKPKTKGRRLSMSPSDYAKKKSRKAGPKVITITSPEDNRYPKGTRVFGASDEKLHKKPHSTPEGRWASIKRAGKRFEDKTYKIEDYGDKSLDIQWKAENKARKQKRLGGPVTRFRSSGPEGKPHSTKEGRSAEAQRAYMRKHGPKKPRRKTLAVTDKYKEVRKKLKPFATKATGGRIGLKSGKSALPPGYWKKRLKDFGNRKFPRPKENLIEKLGGSEKAKPHSTREGRVAAGRRRIRRILKAGDKPKPRPKDMYDNFMDQYKKHKRDKFRKDLQEKIYPKDRKPGDPPRIVDPRLPRPKKDRIMTPLRAKKSVGGRIGLQHGNRPRPQGPHTWVKSGGAVLKGKKVGIQIK